MIKRKIASFESLEFLFSSIKNKYYCITFPGSACFDLVKSNYANNKIIPLEIPQKIWSDEKKLSCPQNLMRFCIKKMLMDYY